MKTFVIITIALLATTKIVAQNDTIWYNNAWEKTTKEQAEFYRPTPKKVGDLFHIKDYYKNGIIQMEAFSKEEKNPVFHGKTTWYSKDGSILQQGTYINHKLNGKFISFDDKKKYESIYRDHKAIEGTVAFKKSKTLEIITYKNYRIIKHKEYFIHPKKQLQQVFYYDSVNFLKKNIPILKKYYDKTGAYLGQLTFDGSKAKEGIEVYYNSNKNNNNIRIITYYENSKILYNNIYYNDGIPSILHDKPEGKKTFYDTKGSILGTLYYKNDKKYNGIYFSFYPSFMDNEPEGIIQYKTTYKEGEILNETSYYTNGQLKVEKLFNSNNLLEKEIAYTENGELLGELTYQGLYPENGFRLTKDKKEWFKNGKIVKSVAFFKDTKLVKSKQEFDKITYFGKDQIQLGVLQVDSTKNYLIPLNGKQFSYNRNYIAGIKEYKNGTLIKKTESFKEYRSNELFKSESFYDESNGNRNKEIKYFSNGKKQSVITFKDYSKQIGVFYDSNGAEVNTYNYLTKTGTEYEYFYNKNHIKSKTSRENGEIISEKIYRKHQDYSASEPSYVLIKDLDIHKEGKFYDKYGSLVYSISFKNKKPYTGVLYDFRTRRAFTYKNGVKDGPYKKFYYSGFPTNIIEIGNFTNNKREGIFSYSNTEKTIIETKTYKEGVLEGETQFYNDGKLVSTIIYKNGLAYEGEITTNISKEQKVKTYKNGTLISEITNHKTGTIEKVHTPEHTQITYYYPNSKSKKYSFQDKEKGALTGNVVRYNKKGKEMHSAVLENGKLISGELWITPKYSNQYKGVAYFTLIKNESLFSISMYNLANEVIFEASEKAGLQNSYLKKIYFALDRINVSRLY